LVIKTIKKLLEAKPRTDFSEVGRNDPCPCGSGRKFKSCHYDREMSRRREAGYARHFKNPK
jgi:hypothetical protein